MTKTNEPAVGKKGLRERLKWLQEKLVEMRRPDGPDYTPSKQMQGRIEGQIGELKWVIKNYLEAE